MTRDELLEKICPADNITECCSGECMFGCDDCKVTMEYMFAEYEARIKDAVIDECIAKINRDHTHSAYYNDVYEAIMLLEQLKEQKDGCHK